MPEVFRASKTEYAVPSCTAVHWTLVQWAGLWDRCQRLWRSTGTNSTSSFLTSARIRRITSLARLLSSTVSLRISRTSSKTGGLAAMNRSADWPFSKARNEDGLPWKQFREQHSNGFQVTDVNEDHEVGRMLSILRRQILDENSPKTFGRKLNDSTPP